ncbi:Eco57I restriction-modification methylase domain-containing protein [Hymenobacter glacialis]|uniref:Eco57I restriction-modification methylase domain-containing protein n=1 Tax=Hymenobacter glacialis TaxID=1908236 RepID=UPI0019D39E67|nr:TaqI-like C-terminal specificity domain-containing protein [Hymenobacter glacialis]
MRPWRFTLVAKDAVLRDGKVVEQTNNARRYTYLLGPGQACRTPADRLRQLATEADVTLDTLVKAFEVEVLSKEFFKEYKRHYLLFCEELMGSNFKKSVFNGDEKAIRDFVKKLLGRLVFLYFVQKKGWLGASSPVYADGDQGFITKLFHASGANATFYPVWLSRLFFETLNEERTGDLFTMPKGENEENAQKVCIPFLNGGLFDRDAHDAVKYQLTLPAGLFHQAQRADDPAGRGFLDFLDSYNFTVQEDSPDEHVVAVDPEMLGNIFENLLEDNKDKGAFYTPKEIVHYMCRESLIEYLDTRLNVFEVALGSTAKGLAAGTSPAAKAGQLALTTTENRGNVQRVELEKFVREKVANDFIRQHARQIDELLDTVKICDPAIGSGAFPMGLLHEIYLCKLVLKDLTQVQNGSLFHERDHLADPGSYHAGVKLGIIQNSIYGVDIERGAVDIARLRFWLSLVVDEDRPRPLPNLDYKIVVGNSLVSKLDNDTLALNWSLKAGTEREAKLRQQYKSLGTLQRQFFTKSGAKKLALQAQIRDAKIDLLIAQVELEMAKLPTAQATMFGGTAKQQAADLAILTVRQGYSAQLNQLRSLQADAKRPLPYFDWRLDFPEVLNPHVTDQPGFDIVIGNPPYGLKTKGKEYLAFVNENYRPAKKVADSYFLFIVMASNISKSASFISYIVPNTFCDLEQGDEFRKWFLGNNRLSHLYDTQWAFEKAVVDTVVFIAQTQTKNSEDTVIKFTDNDKIQSTIALKEILSDEGAKIVYRYSNNKNKYLSKKISSSAVPMKSLADIKAGVILYEKGKGKPAQTEKTMTEKPFTLKGNQPKGWRPLVRGVDVNRYLLKASEEFVQYGNWLAAPRDPEIFEGPVIMLRRTDDKIRAAYVTNNAICVKSCHILKPHNKSLNLFVLAILNARLTQWFFEVQNPQMVGKVFAEIKLVYVENLPIIMADKKLVSEFDSRVTKILAAKAASATADTTALEAEIDVLVYHLYGLSYEEVLLVEPGFAMSEAAYGAAGAKLA